MSIYFKSKLYREEIKHWVAIVALFSWALLASFFALRNESKTILIGIDQNGAKLITESNDRMLQSELQLFLKTFLENYYGFDEKNFGARIQVASNLMGESAWNNSKTKLLDLKSKLDTTPLSQTPEIESIDLVADGRIEAILNLMVKTNLTERSAKLKVRIHFQKSKRSEQNPWGFEITEVDDNVL